MNVLIALFAILALAPPDHAQQAYDYIFAVRIGEADFQRMWEAMPDEAPAAAHAAFHRFAADSLAAREQMIARTKKFERGEVIETWEALNTDWWERRNELEARLVNDVAAMLESDSQRLAWSRAALADRRRYILRELKIEQRRREPFDPILALESVELEDDEQLRLESIVDGCAARIDTSLTNYQRVQIDSIRERGKIAEDAPDGNQRRGATMEQWLDAIKCLTNVCEESCDAIADALDPDHREAYLTHIDRQVYPEAFMPCPAELFADGLRFAPDVALDKRAAIDAILAEYVPVRDALRRQILDMIRRYERGDHPLKREFDDLVAKVERGETTHQDAFPLFEDMRRCHPVNPLLERRHDLALDAARRMRAMFNDSEFAALPPALRLVLVPW